MKLNLGEVGGFSDAVDPAEGHDERTVLALGLEGVPQNVHAAPWRQNLQQRVVQRVLDYGGHAFKSSNHLKTNSIVINRKLCLPQKIAYF